MIRHYCTLFDRNYLGRALSLMASLERHAGKDYVLHAVCLDELSRTVLARLALPRVDLIPLHEVERGDAALAGARQDRSRVEYYWTLTPTILRWILAARPDAESLTYLDADLFFFSAPDPVFAEMGDASILIHGHRFPPAWKAMEENGVFNVGLLTFRRDARGMAALEWWRERCLEWCRARPEGGKMGDQKYLDDWPTRFPGVKVLEHPGAGLAPWNAPQYALAAGDAGPLVDGRPVVFYHFHALAVPDPACVVAIKHAQYPLTPELIREIYLPYARSLARSLEDLRRALPEFDAGYREAQPADRGLALLLRTGGRFPAGNPVDYLALDGDWVCRLGTQVGPGDPSGWKSGAQPPKAAAGSSAAAGWERELAEAEARARDGFVDEARTALTRLVERGLGGVRALNDLVVIAFQEGDLETAKRHLSAALGRDPGDRLLLLNLLGLAQADQAFLPLAHDHIAAFLRKSPGDVELKIGYDALPKPASQAASVRADWAPAPAGHLLPQTVAVSAIVSTYKSERFIRGCLEDLTAQTLFRQGRMEVIVVDSGSPENEGAVVAEFQSRNPRLIHIRSERETLYGAWNRGALSARGSFLVNANADDRHREDAFEIMAAALAGGEALAYSDALITEVENETMSSHTATMAWALPDFSPRQALADCPFGCCVMWRRDLHLALGLFDEAFRVAGDYEFFLKAALRGGAVHVREALCLYYESSQSLSYGDHRRTNQEVDRFLRPARRDADLAKVYPFLSSDRSPAALAAAAVDFAILMLHPKSRQGPAEAEHHARKALEAAGPTAPALGCLAFAQFLQGRLEDAKASMRRLAAFDAVAAGKVAQAIQSRTWQDAAYRLDHPGLAAMGPVVYSADTRVELTRYRAAGQRKVAAHG